MLLSERAMINLWLGSYKEADRDANAAGDPVGQGIVHFVRKDYRGALARFEESPESPLVFYWRGRCRHGIGETSEARKDLDRALARGFRSADLYRQLTSIYASWRDYEEAIEHAGKALAVPLTLEEVMTGFDLDREETYSGANKEFRARVFLLRGRCRGESRKAREALQDLRKVLGLSRDKTTLERARTLIEKYEMPPKDKDDE